MKKSLIRVQLSLMLGLSLSSCSEHNSAAADSSPLDARLSKWSKSQDVKAVHASIDFGDVLSAENVAAISKRYNLKPYTAYMFLGDQNGTDRVPPEEAGVDFVYSALDNAIALKKTALKSFTPRIEGFQRAIDNIDAAAGEAEKERIAFFKRQSEAIAQREITERAALDKLLNAPRFIYGVDVIAPEGSLRELSKTYKVEVGMHINGRVIVPQPPSRDILK